MAEKKIYVLDTSVLLYDHTSINNFQDNDVAIPITVLEELDKFKVGNDTKNFSAREAIRMIDKLTGSQSTLSRWISLGKGKGRFKVILDDSITKDSKASVFASSSNDHKILNAALILGKKEKGVKVVLVSKDINLRLKAKGLGVNAEDYETGKVKDVDKIEDGLLNISNLPSEIITELYKKGHYDEKILNGSKVPNKYYILQNGSSSCLGFYNPVEHRVDRVEKQFIYGVKPKNAEQTFAVHALMNPNIPLVALQGVAGTGKTLLALASALEQAKNFNQIILARPIVPLSNRDIGYLPGDANEKISPYMQPLFDNLKFIKNQYRKNEKKFKAIEDMEQSDKIIITPLAYIRGRSLANVMFIIDEAQNLTPHEVKTIITRAGEGTKIVFTGDIYQIDTPYLDERSNGLTYLIDKLGGNELFSHINLQKGERSELANLANELL